VTVIFNNINDFPVFCNRFVGFLRVNGIYATSSPGLNNETANGGFGVGQSATLDQRLSRFSNPMRAYGVVVSSPFGMRSRGLHWGLDLRGIEKVDRDGIEVPVYPVADGIVVAMGGHDNVANATETGYYVTIEHLDTINGRRVRTRYLHLKNATTAALGEFVTKNTRIGTMGMTGRYRNSQDNAERGRVGQPVSDGVHKHVDVILGPRATIKIDKNTTHLTLLSQDSGTYQWDAATINYSVRDAQDFTQVNPQNHIIVH